ncbi:enoyl-CoA hydratase/isomerase family protein [Nocardia beijingensis]|nr:enoyl-CoA hydratase/isomerase family protein [Nocardia beijingensis]
MHVQRPAGGLDVVLQLRRPKAINALNHSMVLTITEREWAEDDPVHIVVVTGAGR